VKKETTASIFGKHRRKKKESLKVSMTGGTHKSATQAGRTRPCGTRALARVGPAAAAWARPRKRKPAAVKRSGPHAKQAETAGWTKIRMKMNFLSFSFSNFFQIPFSNDF
jgi:hypothetical protein